MNCDQVFDVLTRGPFPTGTADDGEVERHLTACHECRGMAEALRPAVSLFHESLSADEAETLPGYRGQISPARGVEQMVATVLAEPQPRSSLKRPVTAPAPGGKSNLWFVMASVALSAFAIGLWCAATLGDSRSHQGTAGRSDRVPRLLRLASLKLPTACKQTASEVTDPQLAIAGVSLADLQCCRNCHVVPTQPRPPLDALAVVANSCSACH